MKKHNIFTLSILILIVLTGCTTLPGFVEQTDPIPLFDEGAAMYAHIHVKGNESLIESIIFNNTSEIDKDSIATILERSTQLYVAFYTDSTTRLPKVQLALQGMFPSVLVNAALGESQGWSNAETTIDGVEYKHKKHITGIELTSISTSLVMVSTNSIAPIMDRYARGIENIQNWPAAYNEEGMLDSILSIFETSSTLSIYIPDVDSLLPSILQAPIELPVEYAFGTVTQQENENATLDLQLKMSSERLARSTLTILKLATMAMGSDITAELRDDDVIFVNNLPFTSLTQ